MQIRKPGVSVAARRTQYDTPCCTARDIDTTGSIPCGERRTRPHPQALCHRRLNGEISVVDHLLPISIPVRTS